MTATHDELEFIEQTMAEVRRNWNTALQEDFNPIMLACEMLQQSNPSHDAESFVRLDEQLSKAMNIIVENYYSGFNDAVSIFGGVVDGMNKCKTETTRLEEQFGMLGDQIAFKRADLPALLAKQQEYKQVIQTTKLVEKVDKRRREALDLLKKRSFIRAQLALSECFELVPQIDSDQVDLISLQDDINETKKIFTNTLSDESRKYIFLKGNERRSAMFYLAAQQDDALYDEMCNNGLLERHREYDFMVEKKELDALVTAMREIGVLEETVRLLGQRIPLELHQITRECLEDALEMYRANTRSERTKRPFYISSRMKQNEVAEFEGFGPILADLSQRIFLYHTIIFLGFRAVFGEHLSPDDPIWLKARSALIKEANDFIIAFTSVSNEGIAGGCGLGEIFKPVFPTLPCAYSFKITAPKDYIPGLIKSLELPLTERERDSALKLAALTAVDQYSLSWMKNSLEVGVSPSIQYLPLLTYPYCRLLDWAGVEDSNFIDTQLISNYLPFLESYSVQTIASSFSSKEVCRYSDVSDRRGLHLVSEEASSVYVLDAVATFCSVFDQVSSALHHLQIVQTEIEAMLGKLLELFVEKSKTRLKDITSRADNASSDCACLQFARNDAIRALLASHPLIVSGDQGTSAGQIAQREIEIMEKLKAERSLTKPELLQKGHLITQLCVMFQSLGLVRSLLKKKSDGLTSVYMEEGTLYCSYLGVEPNVIFSFSPEFAEKFVLYTKALDCLAMDCLVSVRCELLTECMYHLDLVFREGNYHVEMIEELVDGPDSHMNHLAAAVFKFQDAVKMACLEKTIHQFIFNSLHISIEHLMISNVKYIRGPLNTRDLGVRILRANIGVMEQVLSEIQSERIDLKRARTYYDLIEMAPEQVMQIISDTKMHPFTVSEYQAILKVHYIGTDNKELANQLIRLKYLIDEGTPATPG